MATIEITSHDAGIHYAITIDGQPVKHAALSVNLGSGVTPAVSITVPGTDGAETVTTRYPLASFSLEAKTREHQTARG